MVFDAGNVYWQVDAVRNQCNKNIQKLMEEMHFLEMVSVQCSLCFTEGSIPAGSGAALKVEDSYFGL